MPQYLVGPSRTYTSFNAALLAVSDVGNISGTGIHEIIIDPGYYIQNTGFLYANTLFVLGANSQDYVYIHPSDGVYTQGNISAVGSVILRGVNGRCMLYISTPYTFIENIQFDVFSQPNTNPSTPYVAAGGNNTTFKNCIFYNPPGQNVFTDYNKENGLLVTVNDVSLINCFFRRDYKQTIIAAPTGYDVVDNVGISTVNFPASLKILNCTFSGFSSVLSITATSSLPISARPLCVNTVAAYDGPNTYNYNLFGMTSAGSNMVLFNTISGSNNASSDGSALSAGSNYLINQNIQTDFRFYNSATDVHIDTESVLYNAGRNMYQFYDNDIDGQYVSTWCIGVDDPDSYFRTLSFTITPTHSPSPAYVRLVDTSTIPFLLSASYTRIWSIVDNRTLEEILYSTSAAEFEIALNGIAGDTFNVSLSAVF